MSINTIFEKKKQREWRHNGELLSGFTNEELEESNKLEEEIEQEKEEIKRLEEIDINEIDFELPF